MSKTYQDPVKKKSRVKQREFIAKQLLSFKKRKEVKVICFPGAEVEGEEAIEIKQIYDVLGIPRKNIIGLEADPKKADRLKKANLGIIIENNYDLNFLKNTNKQFDIISLDYTGYRDEKKWQALHEIAGKQLLYGNGILCTNYSARRESRENQAQMLTLQTDALIWNQENEKYNDLEEEMTQFQNNQKANLSKLRNALTYRTLSIMRMGTSALKEIELLKNHPTHEYVQRKLEEFSKETKNNEYKKFLRAHRYDSGIDNRGESHPLSLMYRQEHMNALKDIMKKENNLTDNLAGFFINYFIDLEMKAQFPRAVERYSYVSNKNATMELDLIAFTSAERLYKKINENVVYNPETYKLTVNKKLNENKFMNAAKEIYDQQGKKTPERIYLGSSWKPPKRKEKISKIDVIDLLKSGCSPIEICECYAGFSKMQIAAFKAHYVTMGKKAK